METPSQPEFDRENLNEDVTRMRTLWTNELQEYVDSVYEDRGQLTEERSFINKLYQMEIDRLRYVVASYLRTRLRKVQAFVVVLETHVNDLALGKFAEEHRSVNVEGMVAKPDLDSFVFCESKTELANVQCDDKGDEFVSMRPADRHVLRYRAIQSHVEAGEMTLI
ncbi:hypothetical protein BBJ28_00016285 [Nothophytophthora sp. Chile5]|nr:hypothetical protein BBJ28_00016285 [Nothophytophthora sp. Chile5]